MHFLQYLIIIVNCIGQLIPQIDYIYELNEAEQQHLKIKCIRAQQTEFKLFFDEFQHISTNEFSSLVKKFKYSENYKKYQGENCLKLLSKEEMKQSLFFVTNLYRYGNWCGDNYGGFNNECKHICKENIESPSEKCIECNRPINYVDTQCMYHDFCMTRFQQNVSKYGQGDCQHKITLARFIPSSCNCPYNLTYHLRDLHILEKHCNTILCIINGKLIYEFFDNLSCSCTYKLCAQSNNLLSNKKHLENTHGSQKKCWFEQACVDVDQCSALHSEFGDADEGLLKP